MKYIECTREESQMLLQRIYFSVYKFVDYFVSSLMIFFLLFDVAREAFERHLLSSNRRRCATIKLVLSLSWLCSFCGFFVGVALEVWSFI